MSVDAQSVYSSHSLNPDLEKQKTTYPLNTQACASSNRFQLSQGYLTSIQTVRCLAVIGFVGSLIASVLVPAVIFGAVALTACILKNRVKEKDLQTPEKATQNTEEVAKSALSRSESAVSRASATSQQSSKSWSSYMSAALFKQEKASVSSETEIHTIEEEKGINETFFSCIDHKQIDIRPQYFDLLKLLYFSLRQAGGEDDACMPKTLNNNNNSKTLKYLERKLQKYAKKPGYPDEPSNVKIIFKPGPEHKYALESSLKEQENILKKLPASEKFTLIADIYDKLVDEENRKGATSEASHFRENADHARQYAEDCYRHEQLH